jgi:hypothetical protein
MHTDFEPEMLRLKQDGESWAQRCREAAAVVGSELPSAQPLQQAMEQLAQAMSRAPELVDQVVVVFKKAHAADLARSEHPRTGEEKWDVGRGR